MIWINFFTLLEGYKVILLNKSYKVTLYPSKELQFIHSFIHFNIHNTYYILCAFRGIYYSTVHIHIIICNTFFWVCKELQLTSFSAGCGVRHNTHPRGLGYHSQLGLRIDNVPLVLDPLGGGKTLFLKGCAPPPHPAKKAEKIFSVFCSAKSDFKKAFDQKHIIIMGQAHGTDR